MPIQNTGSDIRLRGDAADSVTDINEEINGNATDSDVSLGTLNTSAFTNVSDGSVVTGRAMSEMQGYSTFTSALPQTEADGALGESLLLDGNNYTFHRTPSLTSNRTTFTYSGWYKFNNLDSGNIIIMESGPTSGNSYISLRIDNANNNIYGLVGTGSGNPWLVRSPELFFDTSSWFHFVFAVDTTKDFINDRLRVYVNGIEIKFIYTANTIAKNQTFDINDGSSRICIGRTARTDQYAAYGQTVVADAKFIDGQQLRPDSFGELVQGIWIPKAFNTPSTDTIVTSNRYIDIRPRNQSDILGSTITNNGTLSDGTLESGIDLLQNNSGILNVASTEKISGSSWNLWSSSTDNTNSTFEAWINIDTALSSGFYTLVGANGGSSGEGPYRLIIRGYGNDQYYIDQFRMISPGYYDKSTKTPTVTLRQNTWYHIACTYTATTRVMKTYLNGVLVESFTASFTSSYGLASNDFAINQYRDGAQQYGLDGKYGDIRVYSVALTNAEVLQNYNATKHYYTYGLNGFHLPLNNTSAGSIDSSSNLKLHLDASDNSSYSGSGTDWLDLTSNSNDATLSGSPNYLSSTNGGVFDFDGSNDYVSLTNSLNTTTKAFEVWLNPDSFSSDQWAFSQGDGQGVENYLRVYSSGVQVRMGNQTLTHSYTTTGKWIHVVGTHNGGSGFTFYFNGKQVQQTTSSLQSLSNDYFHIGARRNTNLTGYFNGKIGQVRIYNKALTAQEVIQNYRATQGNYEQVSTVDISGNANSFTATNIDATDHIKDEPLDNYATLNPNAYYSWLGQQQTQHILSNGNLTFTEPSTAGQMSTSTLMIPNSGKWYFEMTGSNVGATGVGIRPSNGNYEGNVEYYVYASGAANYWPNGGTSAGTWSGLTHSNNTAWTTGTQTISVRVDMDASPPHIYFYRNNSAYADGPITARDNYVVTALTAANGGATMNFGQNSFVYTIPTDYKTLSTKNLPAPTFDPDGATPDKPSNYFKAVTYQGTGGTQGEAYGYKDGSRAAVFNGSSSKILIGEFAGLNTSDYSTSLWFNHDSSDTSTNNRRFIQLNCSSPGGDAGLLDVMFKQSTFEFTIRSGSSSTNILTYTSNATELPDDTWNHIAVTRDNTSNLTTLYINGTNVKEQTQAEGSTFGAFSSIGCRANGDLQIFGKIDEVRIFNKVLNSTEVGYLANDDTANIDAISNLIAHYDMEGNANDTSGSATTYNGTDTNVTYTQDKPYGNIDVGFAPDLVWVKNRTGTNAHAIIDSVRGRNSYLFPNLTLAELDTSTSGQDLTRFDSNGFSLGTVQNAGSTNTSGGSIVAWCWKAGGKAVSNTDGGVPSQVSANTEAGFSILTWTYSSGTATVGHGLDSAPELIIYKKTSGSQVWLVFTTVIDGTLDINYLNTESFANSSLSLPTDSVFSIDTGHTGDYVGYCFHSVDGFSKIGSYTGNGSTTDGPFVYTGFKPAWIMIKQTSGSGTRWIILDNARRTNNPATGWLSAEYTGSEQTDSSIALQFMSNGFKVGNPGTSNASINGSGQTYIYMAFAEDPVKYSNGVATLGDGNEFIQGGNYPEDNFAATAYAGNGGTQKIITGLDADLVWAKRRNIATEDNVFFDTVRGVQNQIVSNKTNAESTKTNAIESFDVNGFTTGNNNALNTNGYNYVAWNWKAAGHEYKSAAFNGSSSKIILPNSLSTAVGNNDFSVSFFVYVNDVSNDEVYVNLSNPYQFYVRKFASGNIYIELGGVNGFDTGVSLSTGWHHIAVTKSSTAGLVLYVDNTANTFSSKTANLGSSSVDTSLGGYNNGTLPLDGKLDQVRIFDKALSSSEVTTVYNETKNTVNTLQVLGDTSCIATYRLNGDALDLSGNYNGTESNIDYQTGSHFAYNIYENKARTFSHKTSTLGLDTGTITPTDINANRDNGFSIIKWTGNGISGSKIPHGLSKPPEIIITKGLTNPTSWVVGIGGISGFGVNDYLTITTATKNSSSTFYQAYEKDIFQVGVSSANEMNKNSSNEYISYAWRSVPGFSKIGKYTGDGGSSNNVYLGFEPKWVMIKLTSASGQHWYIMDSSRENLSVEKSLSANLNAIEESLSNHLDFTSTGFTLTKSSTAFNQNGYTYIYMAFAHR